MIILIGITLWYAFASFGLAFLYMEKITREDAHLRFDESQAPLAPRSGPPLGGWNPTIRQIRENDLPRYIDSDGNVRTIKQDEDGNWG